MGYVGYSGLKPDTQSQDRPVQRDVPFELVVAAAIAIILVQRPITAKKGGIIFFTEKGEAIANQTERIPGEIGTKGNATNISRQSSRPPFGKIPNGTRPKQRLHPALVIANVINTVLENAVEIEFEIQIGVPSAEVSVDRHRGRLFIRRIRKIPGAQPVEPSESLPKEVDGGIDIGEAKRSAYIVVPKVGINRLPHKPQCPLRASYASIRAKFNSSQMSLKLRSASTSNPLTVTLPFVEIAHR